jgi:RNA polymerase sigma-70 factor (sigma-E family)
MEAVMADSAVQGEADFAGFVRANTAALLRTAYLLAGSAAAAEDLVQETFARLFPRWSRVQQAGAPLAYVRRAMANLYVNQSRRLWRREVAVEHVPDRADLTDATGTAEDREAMWSLLSRLPQRQRAALVLRYYHDQSDGEIAAALHCRPGTVRSLLSRGLATLREEVISDE